MRTILILTMLLLAGCQMAMVPKPDLSQPRAYRDAWNAGCQSGFVAAGHLFYCYKKDALRFEKESLYRQGWQDGYITCMARYENWPLRTD